METTNGHVVTTRIANRQYHCIIDSLNRAICCAYVSALNWMENPRATLATWSIAIDGHIIAAGDSRGGWFSWEWPWTV